MLSNSVSSNLARRGNAFRPSPLFQQCRAAARVTLACRDRGDDAVRAEMAKSLSQLAPADHHPHTVEKAERKRPDAALRQRALFILIGKVDHVFGADRLADHR